MPESNRQLAAIMFTDIVGYTALMGSDEQKALKILRESRDIQKTAVEKHSGKWLKEMGDGVLAQFQSAQEAVLCAVEIQKRAHSELEAYIRIGIHLGDITIENEDVFGDGVNIASRLQSIADPGGIYISESIREAVHANPGIKVEYLTNVKLKNVDHPVSTYYVSEDFLPIPSRKKLKQLSDRRINSSYFLIPLLIIAVLTIGWWFNNKPSSSNTPKTIAVLPFTNFYGDTTDTYIQAGIHSTLINELSRIHTLRVTPRRSTLPFNKSDLTIKEIGEKLKVEHIIDASVQRFSDSIQIQIQLINTLDDKILWVRTLKKPLRDILNVQNQIVVSIAEEINATLRPEERQRFSIQQEVNPDAYEDYLRGLFHWQKLTPEGLRLALKYFESSRDKDPSYAPAYAGISMVWGGYLQMGLLPTSEAKPNAMEAAKKALELDSTFAEVHYMQALMFGWWDWNWEKADQEFKKTLEINPSFTDALAYYSHILLIRNREQEAMTQIKNAIELEPQNILFQGLYAQDLNFTRRYREAIEVINNAMKSDPENPILLSNLRTSYHLNKMYNEAFNAWKKWYESKGDQEAIDALILGYEEGGYRMALQKTGELLEARSDTSFVPPWQIATTFTRAGNREKALEWLDKAYDAHDANMPYISCDPIFDYFEDDPRFLSLLDKMDLSRN